MHGSIITGDFKISTTNCYAVKLTGIEELEEEEVEEGPGFVEKENETLQGQGRY